MSHTTSALLSRAQCSVAVAGATGRLGYVITEKLLTTFKPFFSRVVVLTRNPSSPKAINLAANGADVRRVHLDENELSDETKSALKDAMGEIDIVINVLGVTSVQVKDAVAEAAVKSGAKVYFPSEFGVDHRLNDFPGYDHEEWEKKRKHLVYVEELAKELGSDVKIISIYTGLFLEGALTPQFGYDMEDRKISVFGATSAKVTFTSMRDIARSVAQLAILAMMSPLADTVPSHVRIAGCTRNFEEVAQALSTVVSSKKPGGKAEFEVVTEDVGQARQKLKKNYEAKNVGPPSGYIRVLMGEGKLDLSEDNSNELVNPHQRLWRWKTIYEAAMELLT